jgi:hypothetical protein
MKSLTFMSSPDLGTTWVTVFDHGRTPLRYSHYSNITPATLKRLSRLLRKPTRITLLPWGTVGLGMFQD